MRPAIEITNPPDLANVDVMVGMELKTIYQAIGSVCLAYGVFLAMTSVFVVIGVNKNSNRCTKIYQITLGILSLADVIVLVLYLRFPEEINRPIKSFLTKRINHSYQGLSSNDTVSMSWNVFMQKFKCCGVTSYRDFKTSSSFNDVWGDPFHTVGRLKALTVPLACCNAIEITYIPIKFIGPCHEKHYVDKKGCMSVVNEWMYSSKTGIVFFLTVGCIVKTKIWMWADKAKPPIGSPLLYGWQETQFGLEPVLFEGPMSSDFLQDLICLCKGKSVCSKECVCFGQNLSWTELCACQGNEACCNVYTCFIETVEEDT